MFRFLLVLPVKIGETVCANDSLHVKSQGLVVLLSIGGIGGADRTFACKSQECLWQDWYISHSNFVR